MTGYFPIISFITAFIALLLFMIYGIPILLLVHYLVKQRRQRHGMRQYRGSYDRKIVDFTKCIHAEPMKYQQSLDIFEQQVCMICLEQFTEQENITKMSCNHLYHTSCIRIWVKQKLCCPICSQPCE